GPLYGQEFFTNAINHPAMPEVARRLYDEVDHTSLNLKPSEPLSEALEELDSLLALCRKADGN
ncbi:hypothetical protein SB776_36670, partial [Burkholderia sp. SIMBA_045]